MILNDVISLRSQKAIVRLFNFNCILDIAIDFTLFFLLSLNHIVTLSVCKVTTKQGLLRNFIWLESWKTNSDRTRSYIIGKQDWNWPTHSPVIRAQIELTSNLFNSRFVPFDRLSTVATSKQLCYNHKLGENFFFFTNIWNTEK